MICEVAGCSLSANHGPNRNGDIPHSLADVGKAKELLGYKGEILLKEGLEKTLPYYKQNKPSINIEIN